MSPTTNTPAPNNARTRPAVTAVVAVLTALTMAWTRLTARLAAALLARVGALTARPERGDVPGWVMVTLMSAGLVAVIWVLADDWLRTLFQQAIDRVSGP